MKAQRLRFRYSLGRAACHLGQRDLVAGWEQACKAAGLSLAYSEGRRPAPQISIAAPLPQGVTSDCELLDVVLALRVSTQDALVRIRPELPDGIDASSVDEVGVNAPSLQSQVRWAEYDVTVGTIDLAIVRGSIYRVLDAKSLPTEHRREKKVRVYDLRPLIMALELTPGNDVEAAIRMRLRAEPDRTARADQVIAELGLPDPHRIHRTRLVLEEVSATLLASRRLNATGED